MLLVRAMLDMDLTYLEKPATLANSISTGYGDTRAYGIVHRLSASAQYTSLTAARRVVAV